MYSHVRRTTSLSSVPKTMPEPVGAPASERRLVLACRWRSAVNAFSAGFIVVRQPVHELDSQLTSQRLGFVVCKELCLEVVVLDHLVVDEEVPLHD